MLNLASWALALAVAAFTYCSILTKPGMILNPLYNWLDAKIGPGSADFCSGSPKGRAEWLFKPLIGCCKCVAGQFGLWGYFALFWQQYSLVHHALFITFVIYLIKFVEQAYTWKTTNQ